MEIQKELEEQFNIPPYKAAEMISQATKIVNNLLAKSTSFTQPYREAKLILKIARSLLDQVDQAEEG
nr:MAG TPA: hypothetical protein [Caudoviricetes sp.]